MRQRQTEREERRDEAQCGEVTELSGSSSPQEEEERRVAEAKVIRLKEGAVF